MHFLTLLRRFLPALLIGVFVATGHAADVAAPFKLTVVPTHSSDKEQSITTAKSNAREFYVVLTNISDSAQPVFETWNSWGYQNVSFEFTMADGKKVVISMRDQRFTRNFPSTFLIPPGEQQVYPIRLDKEWTAFPDLSGAGETKVTCRAIYEVAPTLQSGEQKVWTGHVESRVYELTLRYW